MGEEKERYQVIILEDEVHNQKTLKTMVSKRKDLSLIYTASDGDEAVRICKTAFPDIAIVDINVPMRSGLEVAKIARELNIAVIFTTAITRYALNAFNIGAAAYLVKPFTQKQFDEAINRAVILKKSDTDPDFKRQSAQFNDSVILTFSDLLKKDYMITPSEMEIIGLIMSGCSRELLEKKTGKTSRTIKSHLQSIYQKTINMDPRETNIGRSDKFGRLIYFLFSLERKFNSPI